MKNSGCRKWIIKAYGEDAAAGYDIFFPQRVVQITQDAKNTIASATQEIGKYGFKPCETSDGESSASTHENGDTYRFEQGDAIRGRGRRGQEATRVSAPRPEEVRG